MFYAWSLKRAKCENDPFLMNICFGSLGHALKLVRNKLSHHVIAVAEYWNDTFIILEKLFKAAEIIYKANNELLSFKDVNIDFSEMNRVWK